MLYTTYSAKVNFMGKFKYFSKTKSECFLQIPPDSCSTLIFTILNFTILRLEESVFHQYSFDLPMKVGFVLHAVSNFSHTLLQNAAVKQVENHQRRIWESGGIYRKHFNTHILILGDLRLTPSTIQSFTNTWGVQKPLPPTTTALLLPQGRRNGVMIIPGLRRGALLGGCWMGGCPPWSWPSSLDSGGEESETATFLHSVPDLGRGEAQGHSSLSVHSTYSCSAVRYFYLLQCWPSFTISKCLFSHQHNFCINNFFQKKWIQTSVS